MSALQILESLTTESRKTETGFEFQISDYFEVAAEVQEAHDAIALLSQQQTAMESILANLEGNVESLDDNAIAAINSTVKTALVAFGDIDAIVTLSVEEEGGEDKKATAKEGKSFKQRVGDMKKTVQMFIKKIAAKIGDFYRKFKTGQKSLIKKANEVKEAIKGEVKLEKASKAFLIGDEAVTAEKLKEITDNMTADYITGEPEAKEVMITGGRKFVVKVEDGKVSSSIAAETKKEDAGEVTMKAEEAKKLIEGAVTALEAIGKIDHGKISKAYLKESEDALEKGESMDKVNARIQYMRALTLTLPSAVAKDIASMVSQISKASK